MNFTWWVNRKDEQGRNIFQGGFLGLDNIGVFDRSKPLPTGGFINQADGTSWMAMYCLNLLRIALELALHDHVYEDIATKFFEHFLAIAAAINGVGEDCLGLWDEADQFYYDHLNLPDGENVPMKIQSAVGLIPLLAVEVLEPEVISKLPEFAARMEWYLQHRPQLAALISNWKICGAGDRKLLSLLRGHRMKALLRRMLDETQFLSGQGVRSLSKVHEQHPFRFATGGQTYEVGYWPAESHSGLFGGNSNWRGPVWMPMNFLLIESLQKFHYYYGDDFKIECPTGSGKFITINEVADELTRRLTRLVFERRRRPAAGFEISSQARDRSAFQGLRFVPRIFSRRQRPRPRRVAPDRLDRPGRETAAAAKTRTCPSTRNKKTMSMNHYDIIIIGSGAGGGTLALKLAPSRQTHSHFGTRRLSAARKTKLGRDGSFRQEPLRLERHLV